MNIALFDRIHDSCGNRTIPATLEEFVKHGLTPDDFIHYVGLQYRFQSELMRYKSVGESKTLPLTDDKIKSLVIKDLVSFCKETNLISDDIEWHIRKLENCYYFDAVYSYEWIKHPMDADEFRFRVERQLSQWWDEEYILLSEKYDSVSFMRDAWIKDADYSGFDDYDYSLRIRKYNCGENKIEILKKKDAAKFLLKAKQDKEKLEKEIEQHLTKMPMEDSENAVSTSLTWVKRWYELVDYQMTMEDIYEQFEHAAATTDVYDFQATDSLFVVCGADECQKGNHLLKRMRVKFSFWGSEDKEITIRRCSHCLQFQIKLEDLQKMFASHGAPKANFVYLHDGEDFSDFPATSVFHDMGYSVSQADGLTAAQRQNILKHAIKSGKVTKGQVLDFLNHRIWINGAKSGNEVALKKWKEDFEYIRKLKI